MNNTQKALINQDVCEQTTPNLGITQSSGLEPQSYVLGGRNHPLHSNSWLMILLLSPCNSSSRDKRQYKAVTASTLIAL